MTLTIPYEWNNARISTSPNGDLTINLESSVTLMELLFNQVLNAMSYDDIIRVITPQSFEQIVEHYNTEYKKD